MSENSSLYDQVCEELDRLYLYGYSLTDSEYTAIANTARAIAKSYGLVRALRYVRYQVSKYTRKEK